MDKFDLKKYLTEGKILKENTSEFPEYEEGKTFLERNEFLKTHNRYLLGLSKEEYDFYVENGEDVFFDKYPDATGNFEFVERPKEYMYEESEFKIVIDDEDYIDENKSTNQIKENITKYEPFVKGETFLRRTEFIDLKREHLHFLDSKEEYDYLVENGAIGYLNKYLPEGVDILVDSPEKMYKEEYSLGNDEFDDGLPIVSENKSTT